MSCCSLPETIRYCNTCDMPILVDLTTPAMLFVDDTGHSISECQGCGQWLSKRSTRETQTREPAQNET